MKEKEEKEVHIKVATIDSVWTPFLIAVESPGSDCMNFSTEQGSGGDPSQSFGLEPSFRHTGSKPFKHPGTERTERTERTEILPVCFR